MELYAPGWDPAIKPAICFSLNAASSGISDLHLEATSDLDASDYAVRLCEVRVTSVGDSLPCLGTGKTVHQVRFYLVSVQEKLPFPPKYRERNGHSWAWVRASGCVCVRGLRVEGNSFLTPKGQEIFAGERRGGKGKNFFRPPRAAHNLQKFLVCRPNKNRTDFVQKVCSRVWQGFNHLTNLESLKGTFCK